ncbi:MAG: amidohydrolase [Saprospiraceae bacterium]
MRIVGLLWLIILFGCNNNEVVADLILTNAQVYTLDRDLEMAEAIAIQNGRIIAVGSTAEVLEFAGDPTVVEDLMGAFVMPGFIEGHGHFSGLGSSLMNLNFLHAQSWDDIMEAVSEKAKTMEPGEWIIGRGWHQEKWVTSPDRNIQGYPFHNDLSALTPDHPVLLKHASGHGLFANAKAMELAGISKETPNPAGGKIVRDAQGQAIGIFEERAQGMITQAYNEYLSSLSQEDLAAQWKKGIELAQEACLERGITSFQDAGSSFEEIQRYKDMADNGELDIRLWAMVRRPYEELKTQVSQLPIINAGGGFFTCRAIKADLDGALGAFGAWLLEPYEDRPDFVGQNTTPISEVEQIAALAADHQLQLCVHAIGDKANREVLNIYEATFEEKNPAESWRWRIEHAQHLSVDDIPRFAELGVIAAMQAIHCTSDAPFVEKRLGLERARTGAYPWRSLLDAGAVVTNGTDAPVEEVDALPSFYASVTRKRIDNPKPFYPEQAMTREEAIYSYTLANAYAAFEEKEKGSLEVGKYADLVVLSHNLLTCKEEEILETKVLRTYVNGNLKFLKQD